MTCHGLSSSPLSVLFNFFFLLERKFFKEGAGRGGEQNEGASTRTFEVGMVHPTRHRLAGATRGDFRL